MPPFDDSDKTVADFDLDAFNKEMEEKEKEKKKKQEISKNQEEVEEFDDFEELDEFDELDDFEEVDEIDELENFEELEENTLNSGFNDYTPDFTDDLDDIDDDLFNEESVISKGLSDLEEEKETPSKSRRGSSKRKQRKKVEPIIEEIEEEEEENASEKTEIFSLSDFEEESSSIIVELAKIKVIEGSNLEEYSIKQEKVVIGRTENNDIMIPNKTISRNHCEIVKTEMGFRVKDLNSGNGIKVNNKKVASKILNSGDIILIGKVKLQFIDLSVEQGGANESTGSVIFKTKKTPKKKVIIIAAAALVVLMILLGVFAQISKKKKEEKRKQELIALNIQRQKDLKNKIMEYYSKGIDAYKLKEWHSAIEYFDKAIKLKKDYTKAINYRKSAQAEKDNKTLLKDSEDLLLKDDYLAALLKLRKVENTSSYYAEAQNRVKIAQKKYKKYIFVLAEKAFNDEDYQKAGEHLTPLLSKYPDFDDAIKLKEKVDEKLLNAKVVKVEPIKTNRKFNANDYKPKVRKKNKLTKGINLYGSKQFDEAIKYFQSLSAKDAGNHANYVISFKKVYAQGNKYLKVKDPARGIKAFNKALSLDGKLKNKLSSDIKSKLAVLWEARARTYFSEKSYTKAYKAASKAKNLGNPSAKKVLDKLEKKARNLFYSAYQKERRDPDSAKRDYKTIISMLAPSSALYKKATTKLSKLK